MEDRGVELEHATMNRWGIKDSPQREEEFHRRTRHVWVSWRMDETYIKVQGEWYDRDRAVDKYGTPIDFVRTKPRDEQAAKRFLTQAIRRHGVPETSTVDGRTANEAAIKRDNAEHGTAISIRQVRSLKNIVEQDHRAVKRVTRPMLGFTSFDTAQSTLTGLALVHMLRKGQREDGFATGLTVAEQFYALAS